MQAVSTRGAEPGRELGFVQAAHDVSLRAAVVICSAAATVLSEMVAEVLDSLSRVIAHGFFNLTGSSQQLQSRQPRRS